MDDEEIIKLVCGPNFMDEFNNFDEQKIRKWQVKEAKQITSSNWVPTLFKVKSQCAGHFAEWVDIILTIKRTISPPKGDGKQRELVPNKDGIIPM